MFGDRSAVGPDKVAAYIRWSTDEQGHGTTLAVQQERVDLFIRSQGWEPREELIFIDDGYSGGTLDRPALTRLREAVRQGRVGCVVVYRLDRLSRSLIDTVNLVRREWEGRAVLCSATENFDTRSPVGQMIFNILASFAEFERSLIRERTASGKRKRAEQGRNAGQRYPLGYRKGPDGGWALDHRDPETDRLAGSAAQVRRVFEAYLSGMGTGTIARLLNAEGIPTPMGREWRFHYVARILRNPIYAGRYRYGRGTAATQVADALPPIVSEEEFQRVQRLLGERQGPRSAPVSYLLTGLARCGRCAGTMAGSRGRTRRYYVCTGRTLLHRCDCGYIDADAVESALLAEVRNHLPADSGPEAVRHCRQEAVERQLKLLDDLEAERVTLKRQRHRVADEFLAERLTAPGYSQLTDQIDRRLTDLEVNLRRTAALAAALSAGVADTVVVEPWAELTDEELRQVLRLLTAELTLYRAPARPGGRSTPSPVEMTWRPKQKNALLAACEAEYGAVSPVTPAGPGDQA